MNLAINPELAVDLTGWIDTWSGDYTRPARIVDCGVTKPNNAPATLRVSPRAAMSSYVKGTIGNTLEATYNIPSIAIPELTQALIFSTYYYSPYALSISLHLQLDLYNINKTYTTTAEYATTAPWGPFTEFQRISIARNMELSNIELYKYVIPRIAIMALTTDVNKAYYFTCFQLEAVPLNVITPGDYDNGLVIANKSMWPQYW